MISDKMRAIGIFEYGGVDKLQFVEVPIPEVGPRDLLVRVKAFALNPADPKLRQNYPTKNYSEPIVSPPFILGWDAAGIVEKVGSEVKLFKVGDEVMYSGERLRNGCYSEYHLVDERIVGRKPATHSFEEAATIPLTGVTVWEGLFDRLGLSLPDKNVEQRNKTMLVIGGAGGVGSMVIQIARQVLKMTVIATASRPESIEYCKKMGADYVINHRKLLSEELKAIGIEQVDYISNTFCVSSYWEESIKVIKPLGSILSFVLSEDKIDANALLFKSVNLVTEFMFTRTLYDVDRERQGEILNLLSDLSDQGILKPRVSHLLDPEDIKVGHEMQDSGTTMGKIVFRGL